MKLARVRLPQPLLCFIYCWTFPMIQIKVNQKKKKLFYRLGVCVVFLGGGGACLHVAPHPTASGQGFCSVAHQLRVSWLCVRPYQVPRGSGSRALASQMPPRLSRLCDYGEPPHLSYPPLPHPPNGPDHASRQEGCEVKNKNHSGGPPEEICVGRFRQSLNELALAGAWGGRGRVHLFPINGYIRG